MGKAAINNRDSRGFNKTQGMIEINNLTTNSIDEAFIKNVSRKVLKREKKTEAGLSIALVGSGTIRQLNKRYRRKNKVTDVLSFSEPRGFFKRFKGNFVQKNVGLGEIIICPSEVKKNAKKFGVDFKTEFARVLIHGMLHLSGYDHEVSLKKAKEMERKEGYYLSHYILWPKPK